MTALRHRLIALLVFVPLGVTACGPKPLDPESAAADPLAAPLPLDAGVTAGRLPNGLQYYIEENPEPKQRAVLQLVVKVGSVVEDDDQLGLAHVVEHMAFNGTRHFPGNELVKYLEGIGLEFGAHLNAHTSFDETVYKLQVPTDDPATLAKAFEVLADWAQGVTFDPNEVEKERGVVLEEWRRTRGAGGRAKDQLLPLTFHESRYRQREPIGNEASLRGFTHDALVRFYRDWYRPDLMAVVAVGDFQTADIEQHIKTYFTPLASPPQPRLREHHPIPEHADTLYGIVSDPEIPNTGVSVMIKVDDVEGSTHRAYREFLVENLVMLMLNERLANLAQSNDPPFLGAGAGKQRLTPTEAAYLLGAGAREGEEGRALQALLLEARRVQTYGFRPEELERAKAKQMRMLESFHKEQKTTDSWTHAAEIIRHFTNGEPMPGIPYEYELTQRYLPSIGLDEVNTAARWLDGTSRVISVLMPKKEGLQVPTQQALQQVVAAVAEVELAPPVPEQAVGNLFAQLPADGSIVEEKTFPDVGVVEWRLSNGARVVLKPTDFKTDSMLFSAFSWGGQSLVPVEQLIPAATAAAVASRSGVGEHDLSALGKVLAGKKVGVNPWISELQEGLNGGAAPEDAELLLQLIHLTMTAPRLSETAFNLHKDALTQALQNRLLTPGTLLSDAHNRLLWQDHPRYRPWTVERVGEMDLARSDAFFRQRFANAADFTFFFVGRLDLEALRPLVARYLASLPSSEVIEEPADVGARRASGVHRELVRAGIEPQASVKLTFHGTFENNALQRYRLDSLSAVLEVMLREQLREELGGTYGVGVSTSVQDRPAPAYEVHVGFSCDPQRADELIARALKVIDELRTTPVNVSYVQQTQQKQRRDFETSVRQDGFWLRALQSAYQRGEALEGILRYPELIDGLSVEALRSAAQRYLKLDQYVQVVLLPKEGEPQAAR